MANQVFVVTSGCWSDYMIEAVFSTEAKAEEYIRVKMHNAGRDFEDYFVGYNIEIYSLDTEIPKKREYVKYYATFINGVIDEQLGISTREFPTLTTYKSSYFNKAGAPRGTRVSHRLDIEGTVKLRQNETFDELRERAKKIAIDEYYKWKQAEEEERSETHNAEQARSSTESC